MRVTKKLVGIGFSILLGSQLPLLAIAEGGYTPWFTGPLLAQSGDVIPAGHFNIEPYFFMTNNYGAYNANWTATNTPRLYNYIPFLEISYGLNSFMNLLTYVSYSFNNSLGQSSHSWADTQVELTFQMFKNKNDDWRPDVLLFVQEVFPSGRYQNLNPAKLGVDATGGGAYATTFGVVFQKLKLLAPTHYLRSRLSFTYNIPLDTKVNNFNRYGGGFGTSGTVSPGGTFSTDLGLEYTLTQNWVPALDVVYSVSQKTSFRGNPGVSALGLPAAVGGPSSNQLSFAPAVEYNFNANVGVIGGVWFTAAGRNATQFASAMFALNWYI